MYYAKKYEDNHFYFILRERANTSDGFGFELKKILKYLWVELERDSNTQRKQASGKIRVKGYVERGSLRTLDLKDSDNKKGGKI